MSMRQNSSRFDEPSFPDYPAAPLPAWQHYGITRYAGQKIQEELDTNTEYQGYLIGLGVSYTYNGDPYEMVFGKTETTGESDRDFPLSDPFLSSLYETVAQFVSRNTADVSEITLITTFSGSILAAKTVCRQVQAGECTHAQNHVGTMRHCRSTDNGATWKCLGSGC
jgi:hypothetical protein